MSWTRRRALGCAGAALALVALGGLLVGANVAAQLNGGWDEVFDLTHTDPDDPEVLAARAEAATRVDALIAEALAEAVLPAIGPAARVADPPGDPAERVFGRSGCEAGVHDWKRDDPFDLACVEVRQALVIGPEEGLDAQLGRIEAGLLELGWRNAGSPLGDRLPGAALDQALPAAYDREGPDQAGLFLAFDSMDLRTDQPVPAPGSGEYPMIITVRVQSFLG